MDHSELDLAARLLSRHRYLTERQALVRHLLSENDKTEVDVIMPGAEAIEIMARQVAALDDELAKLGVTRASASGGG